MHGGDAVTAQEVDKFLFPHRFHLAGLNGFGGHFVRNVGQDRAQTHHVAGPSNL